MLLNVSVISINVFCVCHPSLLVAWNVLVHISVTVSVHHIAAGNTLNWIIHFLFFQVAIKIIDKTQLNPGSLQKVRLCAADIYLWTLKSRILFLSSLEICIVDKALSKGVTQKTKANHYSLACISRLQEINLNDVIWCSRKFS